jgi:hypothetical protein
MSNDVVNWKEKMAARVQQVQGDETPAMSNLSLASGIMQIGDMAVPNNKMEVVILAIGTERTWYDRPYDPDDKSPPNCYSQKIGNDDPFNPTMIPADNVPEPPNEFCHGCYYSQMGTAISGKGPGCKTRRKLVVAPASIVGHPESLGKQLLLVSVPPTSGKALSNYVMGLASHGIPPEAAVTEIHYGPDKSTMFAMDFNPVSNIEDDATLAAIFSRQEEFNKLIIQPYNYDAGEEPTPTGNKKRKH